MAEEPKFGVLDDPTVITDINTVGYYARKLPADYPWASNKNITPVSDPTVTMHSSFEAIPAGWSPALAVTNPAAYKDFLYEIVVEGFGQLVVRKEIIPMVSWFIRDMSQAPRVPLADPVLVTSGGTSSKKTEIGGQYGPNFWGTAGNVVYDPTDPADQENPVFKSRSQSVAPHYSSMVLRPYIYSYSDGIQHPDNVIVAQLAAIYGFAYDYLTGVYAEDWPTDPDKEGYAYYDLSVYDYDSDQPFGEYCDGDFHSAAVDRPNAAVYSDDFSTGPTVYAPYTVPGDPGYPGFSPPSEAEQQKNRDWFKFVATKGEWITLMTALANATKLGFTPDYFTPKYGVV